jgi:hypothetical protein
LVAAAAPPRAVPVGYPVGPPPGLPEPPPEAFGVSPTSARRGADGGGPPAGRPPPSAPSPEWKRHHADREAGARARSADAGGQPCPALPAWYAPVAVRLTWRGEVWPQLHCVHRAR